MKYCNRIRLQERIEQISCRTTASMGWWQQQVLSIKARLEKTERLLKLWKAHGRLMEKIVLGRLKHGNAEIQEQCRKEAENRTWIEETILVLSFYEWEEHYSYWYILSETKCSYFNIKEYFTNYLFEVSSPKISDSRQYSIRCPAYFPDRNTGRIVFSEISTTVPECNMQSKSNKSTDHKIRVYTIFVIYHIFIFQNVEPCFHERNWSTCSFTNYLGSHLEESKDFLRECIFLPLCCYSLNHRHQQSLDVWYWYKLTQWPLDYEPAMQCHSQFKNSVSKSNASKSSDLQCYKRSLTVHSKRPVLTAPKTLKFWSGRREGNSFIHCNTFRPSATLGVTSV